MYIELHYSRRVRCHEGDAAPHLHSATVADGAGGSEIVKSRKALHAGVRVPWDKEVEGDPIAAVSRRFYTYINDATGYGIQEAGQEDIICLSSTSAVDKMTPSLIGTATLRWPM